MKYCKKCGNKLNDGARFCSGCGTSYEEERKPEKKKSAAPFIIISLILFIGLAGGTCIYLMKAEAGNDSVQSALADADAEWR